MLRLWQFAIWPRPCGGACNQNLVKTFAIIVNSFSPVRLLLWVG